MAGPWDKYGAQNTAKKPWERYGAPAITRAPSSAAPDPEANYNEDFTQKIPSRAAPEEPPRSWEDAIFAGGTTAAQGVWRGLGNLAGLPADLLNGALGLIGESNDRPLAGSRMIRENTADLYEAITGNPVYEPKNATERVISRVGEELGAAAVPGGAALRAGARLGPAAARGLPGVVGDVVGRAAIDPAKFIAAETAISTGAGLGAGVANEMIDKNSAAGQAADLIGAVTGAGLTGAARTILPSIGNVGKAVVNSPKYTSQVVNENVVDTIMNNADTIKSTDPYAPRDTTAFVDAIMRPSEIEAKIPGFKASTAERAGDLGLAGLEDARGSGGNTTAFKARRDANAGAVEEILDPLRPKESAGAFSSALETERGRRLGAADQSVSAAQSDFDTATQGLRSVMTGEGRGANLRAALENASDRAKEIVRQAWEPLNASDETLDMSPLAERFEGVSESLSRAERDSFAPRAAGYPAQMADEGPQAMKEITGIRSALTDAAGAAKDAGRMNEARVIQQYIGALDGTLDESVPAGLKEQYGAARSATKDYADRFDRPQDAIAQTLDKRQGKYAQPDSAIAGKFLQDDNGRISDFKALIRETGNDPRTSSALRDQILSDVEKRGLLDKPEQLAAYLDRYKTVLDTFPAMRNQIDSAGKLRQALDMTSKAKTSLVKDLGDGNVRGRGAVADYLRSGEAGARDAMTRVLTSDNSAKAADELITFAGSDPKAIEGARRAFWDVMEDRGRTSDVSKTTASGIKPWLPRKWNEFLDDPKTAAVAERLYKDAPEHLEQVREIASVLKDANLAGKARTIINPSGTNQAKRGGVTLAEVQAKSVDVARGRLSAGYFVTYLASRAANRLVSKQSEAAFQKLLDRALLDPEVAAALLTKYNPANRAAMARGAKLWLGNQASHLIEMFTDEDDETKKAVMEGKQ